MKKFLFKTAIVMFFFTSCNDATTKSTDSDTTTASNENSQEKKNLATSRNIMKAIETGDVKALDTLLSDDNLDHQWPDNKELKGDSVKQMLGDLHNHVKDFSFDVVQEAANGDYVFTLSQMKGTTTDASLGMPASTKIDEKGVDVVKFSNGKAVEHWGFVDPNEMMKRMKAMPANNKMNK